MNQILQYLEILQIRIDKIEFEFQHKSHPNFPSLLSFTDALIFFNIDSMVVRVKVEDFRELPNSFVALIEDASGERLAFIEKSENNFKVNQEDQNSIPQTLNEKGFSTIFKDIVLIISPGQNSVIENTKDSFFNIQKILIVLVVGLFGLCLIKDAFIIPLIILALTGIFLSWQTFMQSLGIDTSFTSAVCGKIEDSDCGDVITSKNSSLFKYLNFTELSIYFFGSQVLYLIFYLFSNHLYDYLTLNLLLLLGSIPLLGFSIYYQKFIEKKWCRLCLMIIAVVFGEILLSCFLFSHFDLNLNIWSTEFLLSFFVIGILSITVIKTILGLFENNNEQKNKIVASTKFIKNYEVFDKLLTLEENIPISNNDHFLQLGNTKSPSCVLTLVLSPYCGHCKDVLTTYKDIFSRYSDQIQLNVGFYMDPDTSGQKSLDTHISLIDTYQSKGGDAFLQLLYDIYNNEDATNQTSTSIENVKKSKVEEIKLLLKNQYLFNKKNEILFTPGIFINGYAYPKNYDRKDINYFMADLAE